METTTRLILPEVTDALVNDPSALLELVEEMHPADLADLVLELESPLDHQLLGLLPAELVARIIEAVDDEDRSRLFREFAASAPAGGAVEVIDAMAPDDRADLVADLPDEMQRDILDTIDDAESQDLRQLLSYPEGTAGARMTTDFVALAAQLTVSEAIEEVRRNATHIETIYQAYSVNAHGTLLGVVSLRDLVTSPASSTIESIMNPNVVTVDVDSDQEEAARLIAKYDLLSLPVVDRSHSMLGIITVDDVVDVLEEEATEDVHRLGAVEPLEQSYMATPFWQLVRARAPWLVACSSAAWPQPM